MLKTILENKDRRLTGCLALFLLFLVAFQLGRTYRFAETDLWWNLAAGREILNTHGLPRHDAWAFTPTLPEWHNHEWLAQIIFIGVWDLFGPSGVVGFKAILIVLIFLLGALAALKRGARPSAVSFFLILTSLGLYPITSIRPQIFTYLFYAWFLYLLVPSPYPSPEFGRVRPVEAGEGAEEEGRTAQILALTSVPLWVGLHGGFVVGLAVLTVYAVARLADVDWRKGKPFLFLTAGLWMMTFLNPYGVHHWAFLVEAMRHDRSMFWEWSPILLHWTRQWPFFLTVGASVFSLALSRLPRSKGEMAVLLFTVLLAVTRARFVPFFVISAWAFVPVHFESALGFIGGRFQPLSKAVLIGGCFALVLYGFSCVVYSIDRQAFNWDWRLKLAARDDPWHVGFPLDLVQHMREKGLHGDVACPLAWGGFLEWELPGQVKVNLDGRWDTVYPQDVIREGQDFAMGVDWEAYLKKYQPDIVLAFKGGPLDYDLSTLKSWTREFEGMDGVIYVRKKLKAL